uniref:Uncharacterized protein n=1 Tax=Poecilia mexicana TaxID=48701 RepID=A0A3B3YBV5_9TELE
IFQIFTIASNCRQNKQADRTITKTVIVNNRKTKVCFFYLSIVMLWNRKYQEFDLVVSSVTTKVKGVAQTRLTGVGNLLWDVADYSSSSQDRNSFFVMTNVIVTKNQKQGKCAEDRFPPAGIQTGSCIRFDVMKKTCEVSAWCPIETQTNPPRSLWSVKFSRLFPDSLTLDLSRSRNILPQMNDAYLRSCHRANDSLCPIFRLGDMVREAGEKFSDMAVEGGVIGIQIKWDCNLDRLMQRCLPRYSFRRLDERESNKTLYPGLNFRFAKYNTVNGVEERTLYKAFGIRFDIMVFGQVGLYLTFNLTFLLWIFGVISLILQSNFLNVLKFLRLLLVRTVDEVMRS